jgi:hypothetical protein
MKCLDCPYKYIRQTEHFILYIKKVYRQLEVIMETPDFQTYRKLGVIMEPPDIQTYTGS